MKRKNYFALLASTAATIFSLTASTANRQKPNIIFIIADDLGKGDLGCYGNTIVKTPNIDAIGYNGIQFEYYRAAAPISGPSRVSLLTGRYHDRSGHRMTHVEKTSSLEEPWLARQLKNNGYTTAAMGKWHLGDNKFKERGFDNWVIIAPGGWSDFYDYPILRNNKSAEQSDGITYATDFLTEEAIQFIKSTQSNKEKKPFFLYLAYNAPHFPLQAPEDEIEPYRNKGLADGTEVIYGMVTRMDKGIGRIMNTLQEEDIFENTIVVFTSDNGPYFGTYQGLSQVRWNCELAGSKEVVLEGGINVPCLIQWPARIRPSSELFRSSMHAVDWAPTLMAAAESKTSGKAFDGVDYLPALTGQKNAPEFMRYWCYNKAYPTDVSNAAIIDGDWKLYRPINKELNRWNNKDNLPEKIKPEAWKLFNLREDPKEENDLALQDKARVNKMSTMFRKWWKEVLRENETISGTAQSRNH